MNPWTHSVIGTTQNDRNHPWENIYLRCTMSLAKVQPEMTEQKGLWRILRRWESMCFGFSFWELLCRPSFYAVYYQRRVQNSLFLNFGFRMDETNEMDHFINVRIRLRFSHEISVHTFSLCENTKHKNITCNIQHQQKWKACQMKNAVFNEWGCKECIISLHTNLWLVFLT